jgi:glycine oxidase
MLGPSGVDGLVIATGHHRNGILLTPVTAQAISRYVLTGRLADSVRPFSPERFASSPAPLGPALTAGPALARAAE